MAEHGTSVGPVTEPTIDITGIEEYPAGEHDGCEFINIAHSHIQSTIRLPSLVVNYVVKVQA